MNRMWEAVLWTLSGGLALLSVVGLVLSKGGGTSLVCDAGGQCMPPSGAVPGLVVAGLAPIAFGIGLAGLVLVVALRVVFLALLVKVETPSEVTGSARRTTLSDTSLDQFKPPVSH